MYAFCEWRKKRHDVWFERSAFVKGGVRGLGVDKP